MAALRALYPPDHPYSRSATGTRATVEALSAGDLRDFHAAWYGAAGMKVSVAGAIDPDRLRKRLERWFIGGNALPPQEARPVTPRGEPGQIRLPMAHKSQVDLVLAGPGIPRAHPDFYALALVNLILGGLGLMGRLGEQVRERRGIAYHVSCRASSRLWAGEWTASAGVNPAHVEEAVEAILQEVRRVREECVTEEELADARDYLIGSLPLRMETNDGIAAYMLNSEYYGLGLDYLRRYPDLILRETRESLREAARRHMDPDRLFLAIAGPIS